MTKPIRLAREARAELLEAARWYGEQRPELRAEFLIAIDEALDDWRGSRPIWRLRHSSTPRWGVKRVFVKRFPFSSARDRAW